MTQHTATPSDPTPPSLSAGSPFASWKGDHAGIRVTDFEQAAAWYREKLDFRVSPGLPLGEKTLAFLSPAQDDGFRIEFIAGPGCTVSRPAFEQLLDTHEVAGWHHVCFRVNDLAASVTALRERGVRIVSEPRDVPPLGLRFAFFCDPWGNLFELLEPLAATER
ncbi:MAG TPA: VOC family protein [Herbaspirillum sp.]|uniref:VOC family protein n=1 Tax=Herbaspirillum sp. TaxID=1890675 RepID=UPI002D443FB9|nr:VOC family protein [Herbaspirillum sp.]HZG18504.1 VOC family protein [Herbaspirillum sp.]